MYLQVLLEEEDMRYTRFLLRNEDRLDQIDTFEFTCWVFGLMPSPCVAIAVSKANAVMHQVELPRASMVVLKSTYMDDSMTSAPTKEEGRSLVQEIRDLWRRAGMEARKWSASDPEVLQDVAAADQAVGNVFSEDGLPLIKTLGVSWCATTDTFTFYVNEVSSKTTWTKREFLSQMAAVFDPLGFVAPTVIVAKIIFQEMWQSGVGWDDPVPEQLCCRATEWFEKLPDINQVRVPRALKSRPDVRQCQLHVFADASQEAYGAVVYLRVEYLSNEIEVTMCAAKGRVTPLKSLSVPRLELMASMIGLKLGEKVGHVLEVPIQRQYHWSDSLDVVCWARSHSRRYKPFIANRIGEIQRRSLPENWRHVGTKLNPADLVSRGVPPEAMAHQKLWWMGPPYLREEQDSWPALPSILTDRKLPEERRGFTGLAVTKSSTTRRPGELLTGIVDTPLDPMRNSRWTRLVRVLARVMRFAMNAMGDRKERQIGTLTVDEVRDAELMYVGWAQRQAFQAERTRIAEDKPVSVQSRLAPLNVWVDEEGILRSAGRLQKADGLSWETRNPVVLAKSQWVTTLIIRAEHRKSNHQGLNATLARLNECYWILSGREAVRQEVLNCRICRRAQPKSITPNMADLPSYRVNTNLQAFDKVSVDFAGPFSTKFGRGRARIKRYLCLFTCLTVRAVHLEMAYSLDTSGFLSCFSRMKATRGVPSLVVSDNGTNFVGAVAEMKALVAQMDTDKIQDSTCYQKVEWRFQPPAAPHFSGVHERMIGAAKRAIYKVLSGADLTDEELMTAMKIAEGLINTRPLVPVSSDVKDELVLTPNHFLIGRLGKNFVPDVVDTQPFKLQNRWRRIQELGKHFWNRWRVEWLPSLGGRAKWRRDGQDVKIGDVVVVMDQPMQRGKWAIGKIVSVFPGDDGIVRAVDVLVNSTVLRRPTVRLSALEAV